MLWNVEAATERSNLHVALTVESWYVPWLGVQSHLLNRSTFLIYTHLHMQQQGTNYYYFNSTASLGVNDPNDGMLMTGKGH